ncbi:MAG TPA: hypothetical protein VGN56_01880 [Candidatus Paceibacterota bacterium]|jgi:hypothetical protein|nr:hypothetical protein [Candidatus Paceibacterota bacterium]
MASHIKQNVMRRVHTIHAVRPLFSGTAFAALLALGSLYLIGRKVWVARVFENMPNPVHVASVLRFFEAAFFNTNSIVQALCIVTAFSFVWLVRDAVRTLPMLRFA